MTTAESAYFSLLRVKTMKAVHADASVDVRRQNYSVKPFKEIFYRQASLRNGKS